MYKALQNLEQVAKVAMDILHCRVNRALTSMSFTYLLTLPNYEPVTLETFLDDAETTVSTEREVLKM